MLSVAALLERAVEYDRLAAQAARQNEKAQKENLAACYRYLAEEAEKLALSAGTGLVPCPAHHLAPEA
jgi:hypothetical protein